MSETPDFTELAYDGAEMEWEGITYTIRAESEQIMVRDLWSDDCYGRLSEWDYDYSHDSQTPRPSYMDGRAVKIQFDRGYWAWWQAPSDVLVGTPQWQELRSLVRDILEMGWQWVELVSSDGYSASIGGVEPTGDLSPWAGELWHEIQADRTRDHGRALVAGANRWLGTRLPIPS